MSMRDRDYEFYYTQDGSIGLYSYADDDVYHSKFGALTEAWEKFVIPSNIAKTINTVDKIKVLDVCYGIGYNTKALMSYVINTNEKFLNKKNKKNIFSKIKNFFRKIFLKNSILDINNDSIGGNNIKTKKEILSEPIETNKEECITEFVIDCLDINEELVKISPLIKTVITPQEIFSRIVPKIFECIDSYWKIKKLLAKFAFKITHKNKKAITELLDLKFNNDYDEIDNEYRIHKFVNYILVNKLIDKYENHYINNDIKKVLRKRRKRKFFETSVINYALFKQNKGYKLISKMDLSTFLHNIYYDHLSNRYKKAAFKDSENLFKLSFHIDDARKTILELTEQYDLIFLDAFTFSKAPELWTVEFMAELYRRLSPRGILMTYSNSALVRNTFLENNFYVGKIFNEKTGKFIGTIAAKDKALIEYPLSNYEIGLCNTRAGIPYHDPLLNLPKQEILKRREHEFKTSDLMTSSQYMRTRINKNEDNNGQ